MSIVWKENRVVKLDTINVPSGFKKRMKEDHVKELAASIEKDGLSNLPVIDDDRNLVQGGDRLAALMLLNRTKQEVRVASGSKDELRRLLLVENLHRRRGDDYDAMVQELAAIAERELAAERMEALALATEQAEAAEREGGEKPKKKAGKKGRPESVKGAARKKVAKELGTTPEAVRQSQKRGKAKDSAKDAPPPGPPPAPVETWDVIVAGRRERDDYPVIRALQVVLDEAGRKVKAAVKDLAALKGGPKLHKAAYAKVEEDAKALVETLSRASLDAVCPYCKQLPSLTAECRACAGVGYVARELTLNIAKELTKRGKDAMVKDHAGGFVLVDNVRANKPPSTGEITTENTEDQTAPAGE